MSKFYEQKNSRDLLREKIIGLGERSIQKSYYPELQRRISELERFRALLDRSNDAIFLVSIPSLQIVDVNESACSHFFLPREKMLAMNFNDLVAPSSQETVINYFIEKQAMYHDDEMITVIFNRDDHPELPVEMTIGIVDQDDSIYAVIVARDITERIRSEKALSEARENLMRSEKLAVLGQLSGTVSHELRNPLSAMSHAVYYLKAILPDADDIVKEYLDIIINEINNSKRIITDLLDFARTRKSEKVKTSVNHLVRESLERCHVPENIEIRKYISDTLPMVYIDPFQIVQVFYNLIMNAVQAMPDGGIVSISAREDDRSGMVTVSITDTGEGISPEVMGKIFQPLFTTKTEGIGLGLTVCRNLIEANGGRIEVQDVPGGGAEFSISLPVKGGMNE
jgi:PAS domain S-box-containing protein